MRHPLWGVFVVTLFLPGMGLAAENLIDRKVAKDTGGIYRYQEEVPLALGLVTVGGALWEGSESRLGRTFWQSSESLFISFVLAKGLKQATGRLRPKSTDDPNQWGEGGDSFPSAHVSATTAMVTPLILEYRKTDPWVMALAALPVYEMVARVKAQEHWQTDVLAGAALGATVGYLTHRREQPVIVTLLPDGLLVGFHKALR